MALGVNSVISEVELDVSCEDDEEVWAESLAFETSVFLQAPTANNDTAIKVTDNTFFMIISLSNQLEALR